MSGLVICGHFLKERVGGWKTTPGNGVCLNLLEWIEANLMWKLQWHKVMTREVVSQSVLASVCQ